MMDESDTPALGSPSYSTAPKGQSPSSEKSACFKLTWAAIMLLSGTFTTLFAKIQFDTYAEGSATCNAGDDDNKNCLFQKPWFSVLEMKAAMALCLPLYYCFGLGKEAGVPDPKWSTIKRVWLPASLDLLNTVLGNVGLVWVAPSIYQMTRGSVVIFSAVLSVKWLGRTLRQFHYWAIFFVIVAVVFVGLAGIEIGNSDSSSDDDCADDGDDGDDDGPAAGQVILGLGFILLAQLVTAIQFIVEEKFMSDPETKMTPTALVAYEGVWGLAFYCVLVPVLSLTPRSDSQIATLWHEDFGDTFVMLQNSPSLCLYVFAYSASILAYNVSANTVTQCLSAVMRSILEACRTLGVWIAFLLIFYLGGSCSAKSTGEAWSNWSFLELFGFSILLTGTFSYKALVRLPCVSELEYARAEEDEERLKDPVSSIAEKDVYSLLEGAAN